MNLKCPIDMDGTLVNRVTLHNLNYVRMFNIHSGDIVEIVRSGEVIPKLISNNTVDRLPGAVKFTIPEKCPYCYESTEELAGSLYCVNDHCEMIKVKRISHFAKALGIRGMGDVNVKDIMDTGIDLSNPVIFFNLHQYESHLKLINFSPKVFHSLVKEIDRCRKTTLAKFLIRLNINGVGEVICSKIYAKFKNPLDFLDYIEKLGEEDSEYDEFKPVKLSLSHKDTIGRLRKMFADLIEIGVEFT